MADTDIAPVAQDPKSLVTEIERTRDNLARTIDAIADRVSPAHVARRARQQVREQAGKVDKQVRERAGKIDKRYAAAAGAVVVIGAAALLIWRVRR
jgi:hypothetical protein